MSRSAARDHDCAYRIEADQAMQEYDSLLIDAGIMSNALREIAVGRRNQSFDPWAQKRAREALRKVGRAVTDIWSHEEFIAWTEAMR